MKKLSILLLALFAIIFSSSSVVFAKRGADDFFAQSDFKENFSFEIEADIFSDITTVKVEINDRKNMFTTNSTTREAIIADILAKYPNLTQEQIDSVLKIETEDRASRPQDKSMVERPIPALFGKSEKLEKDFRKENSFIGENDYNKIKLPAEFVLNRFSGAVKHIEKFISRLENVISEFEKEGKNTSSARTFLDMVKKDLEEAKGFWVEAKKSYEKGGLGAKAAIRSNLNSMKEEIRSAFANLKSTTNALKELKNS